MHEMRVNRAANNLAVVLSKGFGVIAELYNLSGAYECEIEWIEEEQQPFGFVISKGEFFELACGGNP